MARKQEVTVTFTVALTPKQVATLFALSESNARRPITLSCLNGKSVAALKHMGLVGTTVTEFHRGAYLTPKGSLVLAAMP